ncbi:heme exporter protein CcmD [Thalassotalea sediminis]|uniref:heme exporter protein CcmD n=1 Tax=Thalassotalea sediminis TaxID=1759089 RepID=UPI0025741BC7|nr:heme exporter protein CcmD [Thalassotalea sediminis]
MQFTSFAEFIAMDGHGFYVWLSYGFSVVIFALIIVFSISRHKTTIKQIKNRYKREERLKQAALAQEQDKR